MLTQFERLVLRLLVVLTGAVLMVACKRYTEPQVNSLIDAFERVTSEVTDAVR